MDYVTGSPIGPSKAHSSSGEMRYNQSNFDCSTPPPLNTLQKYDNHLEISPVMRYGPMVGDVVEVMSRTWPGINKPGGVGKITKCNADGTYNVSYVLGGSEKKVERQFIKGEANLLRPHYRPKKERDLFIHYRQEEMCLDKLGRKASDTSSMASSSSPKSAASEPKKMMEAKQEQQQTGDLVSETSSNKCDSPGSPKLAPRARLRKTGSVRSMDSGRGKRVRFLMPLKSASSESSIGSGSESGAILPKRKSRLKRRALNLNMEDIPKKPKTVTTTGPHEIQQVQDQRTAAVVGSNSSGNTKETTEAAPVTLVENAVAAPIATPKARRVLAIDPEASPIAVDVLSASSTPISEATITGDIRRSSRAATGVSGQFYTLLEQQRVARDELTNRFHTEHLQQHSAILDAVFHKYCREVVRPSHALQSYSYFMNKNWRPVHILSRKQLTPEQHDFLFQKIATEKRFLKLRDLCVERQELEASIHHSQQQRELLSLGMTERQIELHNLCPKVEVKYPFAYTN